ncbi:MAG: DNA-processing protein DprA [Candidatus Caldarchaeum sp.]|nr:DNA-processing protein DprA [Candidatus Caldarchaeum sp.]
MDGQMVRRLTLPELLGHPLNHYEQRHAPEELFVAGKLPIPLQAPRVSVVGTRNPTEKGVESTAELVQKLVQRNVIVVSGLARGIDTIAHRTTIENRGKTVAVLGTPLDRFYPPENRELQQHIMNEHLAVSQFPAGHQTRRSDFILRNRTMALISDATVIVEAGESSGALSQGWEALRLGRPLFITEIVIKRRLEWPRIMMKYGARVLDDVDELIDLLPSRKFEWIKLLEL